MKIKLYRQYSDYTATLGILKITDVIHKPIYVLENPWLNNEKNMSCIPMGLYNCSPYSSKKYSNVYEVKDVPGRTSILIHIGNYPADTDGCILPGLGTMPVTPMVSQSSSAMDLLRRIIGKNDFELEIETL